MEVQNMIFTSRAFAANSYFLHNTPPHPLALAYEESWSDLLQPQPPPPPLFDDEFQMQHLRFPTPPITPPKGALVPSPLDCAQHQKRTQSVIMKVGQGHNHNSPQHTLAQISALKEPPKLLSYEATSSESSSPISEYMCDWINCRRYFESLESLAAHVTQMHAVASTDGLYYCCWSGCLRSNRGFNARYKMLVHVRTHTKEKPHHCHLCEKSFSRAENLKIHIRSHSGEKPYICTYDGCHKAYSNSSDRFKHTRTHSMEKPYTCKIPGCQKRYTDPSSLRKHVKTFKHAIQLIDTKKHVSKTLHHATTRSSPPYPRYYEKEEQSLHCPRMPAIQSSNYYTDDVCHIKVAAAQLGRYYVTDATDAPTYWIPTETSERKIKAPAFQSNCKLLKDNFAMDLDIEMPLDLRVNRS